MKRRKIGFFLLRLLLYTALIPAALWLLQGKMIYHPTVFSAAQLARELPQMKLTLWPTSGAAYCGLLRDTTAATCRGTVVVFHGNAGSALDRSFYADALEPLGFRVLLAEYPGYGARAGKCRETNFTEDARNTVRLVRQTFKEPVYLWAESLGCGVAAAVAADPALEIRGVVLITPWNNLPDLAQSIYWFLPAKWLVRDRFDNAANLRNFTGPVAVLIAERDEIIPHSQTQALYRSLPARKQLWLFKNAGHNSWPSWPDAPWWKEAADFVTADRQDQ